MGLRSLDALSAAVAARLVFWSALGLIAGDAVLRLWRAGRHVLSVLAGLAFPVTALIWPWTHDLRGWPLWAVLLVGVAARAVSQTALQRA